MKAIRMQQRQYSGISKEQLIMALNIPIHLMLS
jgi:hypothetical protein